MCNKVTDGEKNISHEGKKNCEILVADGDDDHPPIIRGVGDGGGVFYIFDVPREEGLNDFRWNLTRGGGSRKHSFQGDV